MAMTAKPTSAQLREMAALLGRQGGLKKSERKRKANKANAQKPRPRRKES